MTAPTFAPPYAPTKSSNKPEVKILRADFGDGYVQAAADGLNNVRAVVTASWEWLTADQAAAIEAFFVARKGVEPFLWTLSDDPMPKLWTCEEWSRTRGTPNTMEATFRESFNFDVD